MILAGLEDIEDGYIALDFLRAYPGLPELTEQDLDRRTWQWFLARAYPLLDIDGTTTRREATRGL